MGTLFIFHNVRTEMEDLCYEKQFSHLGGLLDQIVIPRSNCTTQQKIIFSTWRPNSEEMGHGMREFEGESCLEEGIEKESELSYRRPKL